ncbi:MAG TPA: alpha-ketoacid dehydrogenase subunit beta [Ilumatobacteraceae bacterium]|nr:alpha-ketoacid dehydrogenase subunit beta [Ilumatobacteraceae bacterium]
MNAGTPSTAEMVEMSYARAINAALAEEMERDERVFLMGQDVGKLGGVFGVTKGLQQRFGPQRVIDTAIVEHAIVGGAAGAAMAGMRPVAEVQFADFLLLAGDETASKLGKWRFMHGGRLTVPVVVRAPMGAQGGVGAEHSQCLEGVFWHTGGLRIVVPSTPADAKGLLKTAIRSDDPVLFFEHRRLYRARGPVPVDPDVVVPFGQAAVRRSGRDVTLVTWSALVEDCVRAAEQLAERGVSAEVLDLRTLQPLDRTSLAESIGRTGRVIVVHEAAKTAGPGAEIAAIVAEEFFPLLRAPVRRVCGYDAPVPQSGVLEAMWLPSVDEIATAAEELVAW